MNIYTTAAIRLWHFESQEPRDSWLLSDEDMRKLHNGLVADNHIYPNLELFEDLVDNEQPNR